MPVKPPRGGSAHVDVHGSPSRSVDADTSLPGPSGRRGVDSGITLDNPQSRADARDIDAIHPAPAVIVHTVPVETRLPTPQPSLDHYVVNARAILPEINSVGLRVFNKRTYADVAGGDLVLVAVDPQTGLHRARRTSELLLGPVMLRNAQSGLWYQREIVEPATRAQIKQYFPELTDQHADDFIARFSDKDVANVELKRIQLGLPQLGSEHVIIPNHQNHVPESHEISEAFGMWSRLRQLYKWQGEPDQRVYSDGRLSGFKLDINLTLWPVDKLLSLRFNSVVALALRGNAPLNPEVFFAQFPNIESLTVTSQLITRRSFGASIYERAYSRFNMDSRFTEQLVKLPRLRELSLQDCDLQANFSLRGMTRLQVLRLANTPGPAANDSPGPLRFQMPVQHRNDLQTDPDISGMTDLRVLDLTGAGIRRIPFGLDADNGRSTLEVLRLGDNALSVAPSLKAMTALQELDLSSMRLDRFPEGITNEIPGKVLNLANNRITSIPESVELRAGFNLIGNPITDPASLRRLIRARIKTDSDIWLGAESSDVSANLWLQHVPAEEVPAKLQLWNSVAHLSSRLRKLSRTPEFHVEYPLLQRRVWWFLEVFVKADASEKARLTDILSNEPSPGKMLDRLEAEIREYDSGRQNQPLHHLPKRPKLD
ncbi:leucine-rich repeat domain-containing protein [Pseudomonas fluorescens]|uniref:leucine-rich repeat domain-containing protein n=1 Tax=Pseudomonas fluorescens TaxID=294 RepID=UPI00201828C2|nr:leucine-rich repeat domain-containing protein [Pseudomonas fluorescens]